MIPQNIYTVFFKKYNRIIFVPTQMYKMQSSIYNNERITDGMATLYLKYCGVVYVFI